MPWTFEQSGPGYLHLWNTAQIKGGIDAQNAATFASKIIAAEQRYKTVQTATGVPWFFIGALHMRESSCNFDGILHNGQKIIGTGRTSTIEPIGVGPFTSWEESAVDALKSKNLHRVQEWDVARMLYSAEAYNGWGYAGKINSPYVWAGTTQEQTGKYIRDHVFDASVDDPQIGIACVLKQLAERRPDIAAALHSEGAAPPPPVTHTGEVLPPLPKIDDAALAPFINALLPVLQLLAARQQGATGGQRPPAVDLAGLLAQVIGGLAPQPVPPVPPPTPKPEPKVDPPKPPVPMTERPSFLAGALALITGGVAQLNGNIPPPIGETANLTGILTTVLPIATMFLGGPIASVGGRLFGSFTKWAAKRQSS